MLLQKIFVAFFILVTLVADAQKIKNEGTFRILKTASSLLEAKQFEAAEEYFKNGLKKSIQFKDLYCEAFAYEGLGNYYAKTEQTELAVTYYKKAISLYKKQQLKISASITENLLKRLQGIGDLYAGIEVGAKGIKLSVIEVKLTKDSYYDYTLMLDTAINTDAASLSYQSEKDSREALQTLMDIIVKRYNVIHKRTYIVISSGLKQELDKFEKVNYFAKAIRPKNLDSAIHINYINADQESELSFLGIVPQKNKYNNNQLDVGSGNTKGGYFSKERKFVPVNFPIGTKSFQRMVESTTNTQNLNDFAKAAEELMRDSLSKLIIDELVTKPDFKSTEAIYLSGGIVWCLASLQHAESAAINNYSYLSRNDITEFRHKVLTDYKNLTKPNLADVKKYEDVVAIEKNITRVVNTYDQKALLAGAIWLDELIKQTNTLNPGKKFIYPKYAYVGWINGYIMKKVNQQFLGLVR